MDSLTGSTTGDLTIVGVMLIVLKLSYDFASKFVASKLPSKYDFIPGTKEMNGKNNGLHDKLLEAIVTLNQSIQNLLKATEKHEATMEKILEKTSELYRMHDRPAKSGDRQYSWDFPERMVTVCEKRGEQFDLLINAISDLNRNLINKKLVKKS